MRSKGLKATRAWRTSAGGSVPLAARFDTFVCTLFGGTADGLARNIVANRASAWRRVTTIAQLVKKAGTNLRVAARASQDGERRIAAITAASCARTRARRGCPYAT
jgi:hypothetical protein